MAPQQQTHLLEAAKRALAHITTADRLVLENTSSALIHLTLLPAIRELRRAIIHSTVSHFISSTRPSGSTTTRRRR